jgi:Rv0078B-related antitoxin
VDPLRRHEIEEARRKSPGEKLAEALEMMATGIRLKRAGLKLQHPTASEEEIDRMLQAWLESDD